MLGHIHPCLGRDPECIAPLVGQIVNLALAAPNDFGVRCQVSTGLEFVQNRIDGSFGRGTAAIGGFFDGLNDLLAVHRLAMQNAQHEKLRQGHFDCALPIGTVSIIGNLFHVGVPASLTARTVYLDGRGVNILALSL